MSIKNFILRRVSSKSLESKFQSSLNYAKIGLKRRMQSGGKVNFDVFVNLVISDLIAMTEYDLSHDSQEWSWQEVYDFFKEKYFEEIYDYYQTLNLNETIISKKNFLILVESYKSYVKREMDEIERAVQDLSREENLDVSVDEVKQKFLKTRPEKISSPVWEKLENTESNEIEKGDFDEVKKIAKQYNKTSPDKLKISLKKGNYDPPMIIKFKNRYHLVAGNTRLCTAAAMGIKPKVLIITI